MAYVVTVLKISPHVGLTTIKNSNKNNGRHFYGAFTIITERSLMSTPTTWSYCRVSTPRQSIDRQIRNAKAYDPDCIIVTEIYTGTKFQGRDEFNKLLKRVRPHDTILFDSVSRMSRNASEGYSTYMDLYQQGVELVFLKEPHINTAEFRSSVEELKRQTRLELDIADTDISDLVKGIMSVLERYQLRMLERNIEIAFQQSEKEVVDLRQRTKEGLVTARKNGSQIGSVPGRKKTTKKSIRAKEYILKNSKHFGGQLTNEQCWRLCGITKTSFYKYLSELQSVL